MKHFEVEYISPKPEESNHRNRVWDWWVGLFALPFLFVIFTLSAYLAIMEFIWHRIYWGLSLLMGRYEFARQSVIPQARPIPWVLNEHLQIYRKAIPHDLLSQAIQLTLAPEDKIYQLRVVPECSLADDVLCLDFLEEVKRGFFLIGVNYTQIQTEKAMYALYYLGLEGGEDTTSLTMAMLSELPDFDWDELETSWEENTLSLTWHEHDSGLHTLKILDQRKASVLEEVEIT